ncbi:MAG: nitronate monooxygenase, partial [Opitutales bacterium]|nr:nitronate monooxygenase [Opitutales bacterium]
IPTLPSLFGAMLAGVNVVLMGAGIPTAIPGVLDGLADWQPVSLKLNVEDNPANTEYNLTLDPNEFIEGERPPLQRPQFIAIVSTDIVAKSMERRASGVVDGYVIENYNAGGHNAPPRKDRAQPADAAPYFGEKDDPNLDRIRSLGKPFWLAGKFTQENGLKDAVAEGAVGLQVGTHFAFCDESGIQRDIKDEVIKQSIEGTLEIETSFVASPTGYPFKLAHLLGEQFTVENVLKRQRVCDMGYLRTAYVDPTNKLAWRCPAEPVEDYIRKGGTEGRTEGSMCLCNGLAGTVGLGQFRKLEGNEAPILTSGEEALGLEKVIPEGQSRYTAKHVIDYLLS